jgi:hypothetical protein
LVAALAAALFLIAGSGLTAWADASTLEIALEPSGVKATDVALTITGTGITGSRTVFVRQASGIEVLKDVRLITVGIPGITFTPLGESAGAAFDVPPASGAAVVTITADQPTQPGSAMGVIVAVHAGNPVVLGNLTVTKETQPDLVLAGAGDNGIAVQARMTGFSQRLPVVSTTSTAITDLRARVAPLVADGTNRTVDATLTRAGTAVPADQELAIASRSELMPPLDLAAELPVAGTYRSQLTLTWADKTLVVPIVVNRVDTPLSITILDAGTVSVTTFGSRTVRVPVNVTNSSSETVRVDPPTLARLLRDNGSGNTAPAGVKITEPLDPFELAGHKSRRIEVALERLPGVGTYSGTLRFSGGDGSVDAPVNIGVRSPWGLALVPILLGVIVGTGLRYYFQEWRGSSVSRIRAAHLHAALTAVANNHPDATEQDRSAVFALRDRLGPVLGRSPVVDASAAKTLMDAIENRVSAVDRWLILAAEAKMTSVPLRRLVDQAKDTFLDLARPPADVTKALDDLAKLLDSLAELQRGIANLDRTVAQWVRARPSGAIQHGAGEVRDALELARGALGQLDVDSARTGLADAQKRVVGLLADDLALLVPPTAPPGFDEQEWTSKQTNFEQCVASIRTSPSPEVASTTYQNCYRDLLRSLVTGLSKAIDSVLNASPKPTADAAKRLLGAKAEATQASEAIEEHPAIAEALWRAANKAYAESVPAAGPGKLGGPPAQSVAPAPAVELDRALPALLAEPSPGGRRPAAETAVPTEAQLTRKYWLAWWLSTLSVALIAAALGLSLLWVPDLGWGGPADLLAAVLWGLGVQAAGNGAVKGAADVLSSFQAGPAKA